MGAEAQIASGDTDLVGGDIAATRMSHLCFGDICRSRHIPKPMSLGYTVHAAGDTLSDGSNSRGKGVARRQNPKILLDWKLGDQEASGTELVKHSSERNRANSPGRVTPVTREPTWSKHS